jgi:hypothetical protein
MTTSLDELRRMRANLPPKWWGDILGVLLDDLIERREARERMDGIIGAARSRIAGHAVTPADPGTVAVSRAALAALCTLYELVHNDVETLDGDRPGYVLVSVADNERLGKACDAIVPHMDALQNILGAEVT